MWLSLQQQQQQHCSDHKCTAAALLSQQLPAADMPSVQTDRVTVRRHAVVLFRFRSNATSSSLPPTGVVGIYKYPPRRPAIADAWLG